ncbi:MAG: [Oscillospiraceae bacterium]|nr:[FeFe] hydrogenase H-cluster radical SAM maturase HydG [Oscillospiraceae bacterium]
MAIYDPKSLKAEEFINDGEILDTLAYAEANKNNMELINEILEKARPVKDGKGCVCKGLTHREASVLLACEDKSVQERIFKIA